MQQNKGDEYGNAVHSSSNGHMRLRLLVVKGAVSIEDQTSRLIVASSDGLLYFWLFL